MMFTCFGDVKDKAHLCYSVKPVASVQKCSRVTNKVLKFTVSVFNFMGTVELARLTVAFVFVQILEEA